MPVVRDRMAEFNEKAPAGEKLKHEIDVADSDAEDDDDDDDSDDEESEGEDGMQDFYEEVSDIKQGLMRFKQNIDQLDELCTSAIAKGGKSKDKGKVEELFGETNQVCNILRDKLKAMKAEINELNKEKPSANIRIRVNIQQTLTKRFLDLMQQYQEVQTVYETNFRNKIKRQVEMIHPDKSPQEVDDMISRGEVGNLLQQNILEDKREHSEAAMALVHLKEQHRDIMQLEASILELHQIFVDIATLIEAQDELIDQIEWNCEQACAWTGKAVKDIKAADNYTKKSRKRCCGCCVCGGGVVCTACAVAAGYVALGLAPLLACNVM